MNQIQAILIIFFQLTGWELLSTVKWERVYDDMLGQETEVADFSEQLKLRAGTEITVSGFVIPLEAGKEQRFFVLSRFPYQSCFFCGAAGPETVAEVYPSNSRDDLQPDQKITVKGILTLNETDPMHLSYIIKQAEIFTD
jgi:uncharacterized membrane protein YcgQ (UPF0703/DUF1980 family)